METATQSVGPDQKCVSGGYALLTLAFGAQPSASAQSDNGAKTLATGTFRGTEPSLDCRSAIRHF